MVAKNCKWLVFLVTFAFLLSLPSFVLAQTDEPAPVVNPTPHVLRIGVAILLGIAFLALARVIFRLKCPRCRSHIRVATSVLEAPTSSGEGRGRTVFECLQCDYREEKEQPIPMRGSHNRPTRGEVLTGKESGDEARRRARESFKKDIF